MESLLRPMTGGEKRLFVACVVLSAAVHLVSAWLAVGPRSPGASPGPRASRLAERFAAAVNGATDLDARDRARVDEALGKVDVKGWRREEIAASFQWAASGLGLAVRDCELVRSLDPERSREGRWDLRTRIEWGPNRAVSDLLTLALIAGEGTLKSDFGSHRFWVELDAPDGAGRVAFETIDCRLYRAGKLGASDLLHRAAWAD